MQIDKFPPSVIDAARTTSPKWGLFPSVTLAQWALESAYGARMSGKNNPFGIKATASQAATVVATHEAIGGRMVATTARFADYGSMDEAFDAHGRFLSTPRYARVRAAKTPAQACDALKDCGYATDPQYPLKLVNIITQADLTAMDTPVVPGQIIATHVAVPAKPVHKGKVAAAATAVVAGAGGATVAVSGHPELHGVVWGLLIAAVVALGVFLFLHFRKK